MDHYRIIAPTTLHQRGAWEPTPRNVNTVASIANSATSWHPLMVNPSIS